MNVLSTWASPSDGLTALSIWVLSVSILKTSFVTKLDNWVKSTDYILVWCSSNSLMDFIKNIAEGNIS